MNQLAVVCCPAVARAHNTLPSLPERVTLSPRYPLMVAIGAILLVGSLFLSLSAHHLLPGSLNAISRMGISGQLMSYGVALAGICLVSFGGVKWYYHRQEVREGEKAFEKSLKEAQKTKEEKTAKIIQKTFRKHLARVKEKAQQVAANTLRRYGLYQEMKGAAATLIQTIYRGHLARTKYKALTQKRLKAAQILQGSIQTYFCTRMAQKMIEEMSLPSSLVERAARLTESEGCLFSLPHPEFGRNRQSIFMPEDQLVVIRSGKSIHERHCSIRRAQQVCFEKNLTLVKIPRTHLHTSSKDQFLIEDRLPNHYAQCVLGMGYYYQNREKFTKAVEEFTIFSLHVELSDFFGGCYGALNRTGISEVPRFDNILLYSMREGDSEAYKIGIIDFEGSSFPWDPSIYWGIYQPSVLFPYHFDTIVKTAKANAPGDEISDDSIAHLRAKSSKVQEFYTMVIEKSLARFDRFQITPNHQVPITFSAERKEALKKQLGKKIRYYLNDDNTDPMTWHFLKGDPSVAQHRFEEELFPLLLEEIVQKIFSRKSKATTYPELLNARVVEDNICHGLVNSFLNSFTNATLCSQIFVEGRLDSLTMSYQELVALLVEGGEVGYFGRVLYGNDDLLIY